MKTLDKIRLLFESIHQNFDGNSQRILWVLPDFGPGVAGDVQQDIAENLIKYIGFQSGRLFGKTGRFYENLGKSFRYDKLNRRITFGVFTIQFVTARAQQMDGARRIKYDTISFDSNVTAEPEASRILYDYVVPRAKRQCVFNIKS